MLKLSRILFGRSHRLTIWRATRDMEVVSLPDLLRVTSLPMTALYRELEALAELRMIRPLSQGNGRRYWTVVPSPLWQVVAACDSAAREGQFRERPDMSGGQWTTAEGLT